MSQVVRDENNLLAQGRKGLKKNGFMGAIEVLPTLQFHIVEFRMIGRSGTIVPGHRQGDVADLRPGDRRDELRRPSPVLLHPRQPLQRDGRDEPPVRINRRDGAIMHAAVTEANDRAFRDISQQPKGVAHMIPPLQLISETICHKSVMGSSGAGSRLAMRRQSLSLAKSLDFALGGAFSVSRAPL